MKDCPIKYLIKPALYAFWKAAPPGLRNHISAKINFRWDTVENFTRWCAGLDLEMKLGNHLLLFWWIMDFWKGERGDR